MAGSRRALRPVVLLTSDLPRQPASCSRSRRPRHLPPRGGARVRRLLDIRRRCSPSMPGNRPALGARLGWTNRWPGSARARDLRGAVLFSRSCCPAFVAGATRRRCSSTSSPSGCMAATGHPAGRDHRAGDQRLSRSGWPRPSASALALPGRVAVRRRWTSPNASALARAARADRRRRRARRRRPSDGDAPGADASGSSTSESAGRRPDPLGRRQRRRDRVHEGSTLYSESDGSEHTPAEPTGQSLRTTPCGAKAAGRLQRRTRLAACVSAIARPSPSTDHRMQVPSDELERIDHAVRDPRRPPDGEVDAAAEARRGGRRRVLGPERCAATSRSSTTTSRRRSSRSWSALELAAAARLSRPGASLSARRSLIAERRRARATSRCDRRGPGGGAHRSRE